MPQDHDAGYRLLFSDPRLVRDLVCGFIDDSWVQQLDFSTLERACAAARTGSISICSSSSRAKATASWPCA